MKPTVLHTIAALVLPVWLSACAAPSAHDMHDHTTSLSTYASPEDRAYAAELAARRADWRNGAIVYHVFVDRFAPSADLEAKRHLYPKPKVLRTWDEQPERGVYDGNVRVWTHEIEFWGGDIDSLRSKLDHIHDLGADVLYLNPIHEAYTNHKYDALDYFVVSPEYGTREDVAKLASDLHKRGMKLMLDGVFNHMGRNSPKFQEAKANEDSAHRFWFYFDERYKHGYRAWYNAANLPEINLDDPRVKARLYDDADSVVRGYLTEEGVDGWRLDVAYDFGPNILAELTEAAHDAKPGSWVVGEIWNEPSGWIPAVDGVMNFHLREMILSLVRNEASGAHIGRLIERLHDDVGLRGLLRSWIVLDNHDTARLATIIPDPRKRAIAQTLQFTLPGAPVVYYGVEAGMTGGNDPEMRGPMDWDRATPDNSEYQRLKALIDLRSEIPALRVGDFKLLDAQHVLAFQRTGVRAGDTVTVIVNVSDRTVKDLLSTRNWKAMNFGALRDQVTGEEVPVRIFSGMLHVEIPPMTVWVLRNELQPGFRYSPYKRIH